MVSKAHLRSRRSADPEAEKKGKIHWLSLRHALVVAAVSFVALLAARLLQNKAAGSSDENIFKVVDLPGKGKGLVATRDIQQGELIIRERPLFVVPPQTSTSPSQLIWSLVQNLSQEQREAFLNLSFVHLPKGVDPQKQPKEVALAIFQTNAVSAGDGVGIFPGMARLNHGCAGSFNSVYNWREEEGVLIVHALKSISKGQELLTTYTDTKKSRAQRRSYLAEHYGFECKCSVCSLGDALSRESDERLSTISELYGKFSTWGQGQIDGRTAVLTVNRIWKLGDEEGYWSERGRLAADAAWVAASHSDYEATRRWAEAAVRWYGYELGDDSRQVREMRAVVAMPDGHGAWGLRERAQVGGPG
ncbi:hypothetical protein AX17_005216 [Amanita inopinata Kibby_2008]|nr:hypothetical protein AX17_005216 [Amanita inopinata Kibby_2008]